VTVIGILDPTALAADARTALAGADVIVGGEAQLEAAGGLAPAGARRVVLGPLAPGLEEVVAARAAGRRLCVLASGDPGFFGIVRALASALGPDALVVHPAPSSVAVAFARLGLPWDDAAVISAHGRPLAAAVRLAVRAPKVAVLTAPDTTAELLAAALVAAGAVHEHAAVCERLGGPDEAVTVTDLAGVAGRCWDARAVMVLWSGTGVSTAATTGFGLPTNAYAHRDGMITKPEVRSLVLGLLDLPTPPATMWDVGAGSGSVAIECARQAPALEVIAVDADADAASACAANARRHGVAVRVVRGVAPGCLAALPDPDRVFVGGGGIEVIAAARARVAANGRVVATHAALERAAAAASLLGEMACVSVSGGKRLPDGGWRLEGANPVFVTWGPGSRR